MLPSCRYCGCSYISPPASRGPEAIRTTQEPREMTCGNQKVPCLCLRESMSQPPPPVAIAANLEIALHRDLTPPLQLQIYSPPAPRRSLDRRLRRPAAAPPAV